MLLTIPKQLYLRRCAQLDEIDKGIETSNKSETPTAVAFPDLTEAAE